MLQAVQKAAAGIATGGLPTLDHRAGRFIKRSVDLSIEAKSSQPALHVAALTLVEANLVFGDLGCFVGEGRGIDASGQVSGRRARAILQRGDPRQCKRLKLAVGVASQVGV